MEFFFVSYTIGLNGRVLLTSNFANLSLGISIPILIEFPSYS